MENHQALFMENHQALFMENQAGFESSLRRSARLGLEVLERASRRRVDWTDSPPALGAHGDGGGPIERTRVPTDVDEAFATIGVLMAQTTHQCMNVHGPDCCSELSGAERTHVSRYHTHQAAGRTTPEPLAWKQSCSLAAEDFHIEVSPGSYSITAGLPHAHRQTQRVSLHAGDSITLTFDLSPLS